MVRAAMRIDDRERRARLVRRHHLGRSARDVLDAVRAVVAMHSSDPLTPHLGAWARVPGFTTAALEGALAQGRSLWRLHAMRRTLFVVPRDGAAVFEGAASRDVAAKERKQLEAWVRRELPAKKQPGRWLAGLEAQVLDALAEGEPASTQQLSARVPALATEITLGQGKWAQRAPIASRLLFVMALDLAIARTHPGGTWRSSQYRWARAESWFGAAPEAMDPAAARAELARRYLASHGPATRLDVRWWTGWTARHADAALAAIGAEPVELEGGAEGLVLPGDAASLGDISSQVALLPGLDPTPMGYKERAWFLGPHQAALFDRNGNVGPTVWLDGRIVGGWAQRADGAVVTRVLERISKKDGKRIDAEAARLTEWMDGTVVTPRFRTPLERELAG